MSQPLKIRADAGDAPAATTRFSMGTSTAPDGKTLTFDSISLLRDAKRWLPVMGEVHFSRLPADAWVETLRKMKAGGIDIAATYVFWIHHEEVQGQYDFTGQRDLRKFVQDCALAHLPVIVRCGPWCHGEVRNGGLPDWLMPLGKKLRSDDPEYLAHVRDWYTQIAKQLDGLLFKDGGPVIGIQLDNEFYGDPQHLLTLKKIAREAGLDVPIYTRTGWPQLPRPIAFGEIVPLYGGYAEGFWDRVITPMPGKYWHAFMFTSLRTDAAVGTDQLGQREAHDAADAEQYPYLTCEIGGGMMSSYHRRIKVDPRDVAAVTLIKLGSGSNLPGYYMYAGGTNPEGKLSTLQESQASKYPNDLPIKTYDFQAPIGEFGQIRPQYHLQRRLHLFLRDFGEALAPMRAAFPEIRQRDGYDTGTLRWSIRTDGARGFIFVNNYQRMLPMPQHAGVQFEIALKTGPLLVPAAPITVPADASFLWPFNLELAGAKLIYSTAQPICTVERENETIAFFTETAGIPAEFVFEPTTVDGASTFKDVKTAREPAVAIKTRSGQTLKIILLSEADSIALWKIDSTVFLTKAAAFSDGTTIQLQAENPGDLAAAVLNGSRFEPQANPMIRRAPLEVKLEAVRPPAEPREIKLGSHKVAEAPGDADFESAAAWRIHLPENINDRRHPLLRLTYRGDVARIYLDGKLIDDNFYNGDAFDIGLSRFGPEIYKGELILKILPMPAHAPIYLSHTDAPEGAEIISAQLIEQLESHL